MTCPPPTSRLSISGRTSTWACGARSACGVQTLDGEPLAWLYALDAYEGGLPTVEQLATVADAAEAGGAPSDYVERIRQHPCQLDAD